MTFDSRTTRFAYLLHGALSLLVVGVLGWATIASLHLERAERAERQSAADRAYENRVRVAMYRMEAWANALLAGEFQLNASDYAPLYFPGTDEIRVRSGEMLEAGYIVRLSPLMIHPQAHDRVLLHFQASPHGGFRSPQLVPEPVRGWPDLDTDDVNRDRYGAVLASLAYSYTADELVHMYEEAGGAGTGREDLDPQESGSAATLEVLASAQQMAVQTRNEFQQRSLGNRMLNAQQVPPQACAPGELAASNIAGATLAGGAGLDNAADPADEDVSILYRLMRPVWLKLANRDGPDLAFLRAVSADDETAIYGFIVDWPHFREELLAVARDLFTHAEIEIVASPEGTETELDETAFALMPARLVTNEMAPPVAAAGWSTTRTVLAVSWIASVIMLTGLGLGIRSLVSLSDRRSQFAYAVTHELRTPLTTFRLYTDMLAQGLVGEESRQEYLETLNSESCRLADLVSGVLEYSRIESHSVPLNRERVSVQAVLDAVRESWAQRCERADVSLAVEPGEAGAVALDTDHQHLVQIIGNLVDNACKYGRNGESGRVTLSAAQRDGRIHFEVADEGEGIPSRLRNAIFKPYRRGDSESAPATGGIGLGLALSRSWAQLLGGQLELLPTPKGERGARFRVSLPI